MAIAAGLFPSLCLSLLFLSCSTTEEEELEAFCVHSAGEPGDPGLGEWGMGEVVCLLIITAERSLRFLVGVEDLNKAPR